MLEIPLPGDYFDSPVIRDTILSGKDRKLTTNGCFTGTIQIDDKEELAFVEGSDIENEDYKSLLRIPKENTALFNFMLENVGQTIQFRFLADDGRNDRSYNLNILIKRDGTNKVRNLYCSIYEN